MSWIKVIPPEEAEGKLKSVYDRVRTPGKRVDNILQVHSLRPHTLEGHMTLYKNVLHHSGNSLSKWFLETIGVYVSLLNQCNYCVDHHYAGLHRLLTDEPGKAEKIRMALNEDLSSEIFTEKEILLLNYVKKLTRSPSTIEQSDILLLQENGIDDGEILEVNQVAAYFSYANRTVQGLGTTTRGDELGLSPGNSNHPDDWSHS